MRHMSLINSYEVTNEWDKRAEEKNFSYSRIRSLSYEALSYRIIMGLSKIFVGKKEYSIEKTINVISQWEIYKQKKRIRCAVNDLQRFLQKSQMVKNVIEYRDRFLLILIHIVQCPISE